MQRLRVHALAVVVALSTSMCVPVDNKNQGSVSPTPSASATVTLFPQLQSASPRSNRAIFFPGDTATGPTWAITVVNAVYRRNFRVGSQTFVPNGIYLAVVLRIRNLGTRNIGLSPLAFQYVYDTRGEERYDPDLRIQAALAFAQGGGGSIALSDLAQIPPGIDLQTILVFDIRPDLPGADLRFREMPEARFEVCFPGCQFVQ